MTEDQIKAIAEEYARLNPPSTNDEKLRQDGICLNAKMVFEPFLRFLNDRYCIAEREKVVKSYDAYVYLSKEHPIPSEREKSRIVVKAIADLFGTSMSNQNEE